MALKLGFHREHGQTMVNDERYKSGIALKAKNGLFLNKWTCNSRLN